MKKIFTVFLALALCFGLKAQTGLTQAVNFTVADVHGNEVQPIINTMEAQGIGQHNCDYLPSEDPQVTVIIDEVTETSALITIMPNEYCAVFYYNLLSEAEMQAWINYTGLEVGEILREYGLQSVDTTNHFFEGLEPEVEYFVWVVPADAQGKLYEVQQVPLVVVPPPPDIMPDFTGTDIDGNEIHLYDILDGGQTVLINLFLRDAGSGQIMPYITESYHLFGCNQNDVFYIEICPQDHDEECRAWATMYGVTYPTISRTGGGNDIAQSIPVVYYPTVIIINPNHTIANRDLYPIVNTQTIVNALEELSCQQHECTEGIEEIDHVLNLYPNPADDFITIKGKNLDTVSIFNALGQKVDEFKADGNELSFSTAKYSNGIYFIKAGETVMKFVVKH